MNPFLAADLIEPGLMAAAGAGLMWWPRFHRVHAQRRNATRLRQLDAGAEEAFFEERRALAAYRPAGSYMLWRLFGGILFLAAGLDIYQLLYG